ncbi:hypothetical protein [Mesobacillus foraminis]|uniref:hypothetical protein n=1 Tax=Mesobacillus foraminis TaxID=279826 RepID=UPI000EF4F1BE|nr:hypothetical protein [Mesobacillus foraminis]
MTYFKLGSLTVPAVWFAASAALFIGSLFYKVIVGRKVGDWYWNGFFLYFLTWKLSYIIFHLDIFLKSPLSILYFNGGTKGHIMALAIFTFYLLIIASKKYPSIYEESPRIALLFFICYEVILSILEKSSIETIVYFMVLSSYLPSLIRARKKKSLISNPLFILYMLLLLLMFSVFETIFTLESLTFIWVGMTVFILRKREKGGQLHE